MVLAILALTIAPLDLLLPKIPVGGTVRDGISNQPIAGATVKLGTATLTTDATGAFSLDRVSLTDTMTVEADGYQSGRSRVWPPRDQHVDLLPRVFTLSVRDAETNEVIADASAISESTRVRPVAAGRYSVEPAREAMTVTVSAPGFRDAVVRYQGESEITAFLQPRLLGMVMDGTTGRPIPQAFISEGDFAVTSDANGQFELERRPSGPLRVLAPGYRRAEVDSIQDRMYVARLEPFSARAVYLTYYGVGDRDLRENALALAGKTDVNAVVIDVKGDQGKLTYRSSVPLAQTIGADSAPTVPSIDELLASLKQRGIYTIARIAVFRDDVLARNGDQAGLSVAIRDGTSDAPWADHDGIAWVDPLRPEVWEYNVDLAREAALKGFDEVQFDYVRFPVESSSGTMASQARYSRPWLTDRDRVNAVSGFLRRAHDEVRLAGAFVSVSAFGYVAWNDGDNEIGQDLILLADTVDYLCPTVFPSSFRAGLPGLLNFPQVVQRPHDVVFESVRRARARTHDHGSVLRPWLQYFDDYAWQTGRAYRTAEIDAQRNGALSAGAGGWMMWDPSNRYARGGLGTRP
ncbi:MAG: putative glycoside hydrolase [Chloroflexota bacterium]